MHQIGQNLLLEFVRLNKKRNMQKAQQINFFEQEQMYHEFSRLGLEDWLDLYTEEDVQQMFQNQVVVLNHNERHTYDNLLSLTPVSSGFHIGSSNWCVEVAQMKLVLLTNASVDVSYRHPMPFSDRLLQNPHCMFISSVVAQTSRPSFDGQISCLLDKMVHCLQSNFNAKVLMPV